MDTSSSKSPLRKALFMYICLIGKLLVSAEVRTTRTVAGLTTGLKVLKNQTLIVDGSLLHLI